METHRPMADEQDTNASLWFLLLVLLFQILRYLVSLVIATIVELYFQVVGFCLRLALPVLTAEELYKILAYEKMPFKPVHYFPKDDFQFIRALPVYRINIVGYPRPTFCSHAEHWCMYLQTGTAESISVDMTPDYTAPAESMVGGSKGSVLVTYETSLVPNNTTKLCAIKIVKEINVRNVIDALIDQGLDRFEFARPAVGCRKWMHMVLGSAPIQNWARREQLAAASKMIKKTCAYPTHQIT